MSKGGGTQTEYVTQSVDKAPWDAQQPHLKNIFSGAEAAYNSDQPEYFEGSTVVPFSPQSDLALRMVENRALAGSGLNTSAQSAVQNITDGNFVGAGPGNSFLTNSMNYQNAARSNIDNLINNPIRNEAISQLQSTANGTYLDAGNPYLANAITASQRPVIDQFMSEVAPGIDSNFAQAGRLNSGAYANVRNRAEDTLTRNLSEAATQAGAANYAQERQNQLSAQQSIGNLANTDYANNMTAINALTGVSAADQNVGMTAANALGNNYARDLGMQMQGATLAPDMANLDFSDAQRLAGVGAARESQSQAELTDQINRWNFEQNKEMDKLGKYMALVGGGFGSTGTETKPVFSNPSSQFLGSAASGAGLAQMMGVNPIYGGIGGGLLSMFG